MYIQSTYSLPCALVFDNYLINYSPSMRFSNVVREQRGGGSFFSVAKHDGKNVEELAGTKTISKAKHYERVSLQTPLRDLRVFYDRTAFFFRTIFTDGREIVVIVREPVCSLASASVHGLLTFIFLRRFVRYRARNTELLRVLNFLERIVRSYARDCLILLSRELYVNKSTRTRACDWVGKDFF